MTSRFELPFDSSRPFFGIYRTVLWARTTSGDLTKLTYVRPWPLSARILTQSIAVVTVLRRRLQHEQVRMPGESQ